MPFVADASPPDRDVKQTHNSARFHRPFWERPTGCARSAPCVGHFHRNTALNRQTIKDREQRTLGYIETLSDGRQRATDAANRPLGVFDPRRNVTLSPNNRILAKANILAGLIYDQR